jgi:hypothetical protein
MQFLNGRLLDSPITFIVISVAAILLLVFLKHVFRWTIKLIAILLLVCAVIALLGYWQNWLPLTSAHEPRPVPTRRANPTLR